MVERERLVGKLTANTTKLLPKCERSAFPRRNTRSLIEIKRGVTLGIHHTKDSLKIRVTAISAMHTAAQRIRTSERRKQDRR